MALAVLCAVQLSMAQKGEAWQNGYAERAIRTIKEECIELEDCRDYADARRRIGTFLEDVYNGKRSTRRRGI